MNQSNQQILIVEIKTVDSSLISTQQLEEMIVYQDQKNQYFLSKGIEQIKTAILKVIPRLGSNYRHPLLFDVQIFLGDDADAQLARIDALRSRVQGRKRRG